MKKHLLLLTCLFFASFAFSQNLQWARGFGNTGSDAAKSVAVDPSGNVYATGSFSGTVDFDPGAGTFTMSPIYSNNNAYVVKLDASGNFVWARSFNTTTMYSFSGGYNLCTDASGNVYVAGLIQGVVDFDPGPGTSTLSACTPTANNSDVFVTKLDGSGNLVWARCFGGTYPDMLHGITVDASNNVFTTGVYQHTADFDPGAGAYNLTSAGAGDIFISKLDASGNFVWAKSMGGNPFNTVDDDVAYAIALDAAGNIFTTGMYYYTADFDPGPGTYTLTAQNVQNSDMFISKLDASGNFVWAKSINGSYGESVGHGLVLDAAANLYITGDYALTTDFDPGPGTYTLATGYNSDAFIAKYDSTCSFAWAKKIGGTDYDHGLGIALDASGNVITTGTFRGTVDFDPGPGTYSLTCAGTYNDDIFISKLDASGNYIYAEIIGSNNVETPNAMVSDAAGNIYICGSFPGTVDFDPSAGVYNLVSTSGTLDAFVMKLGTCTLPSSAAAISGSASVCQNGAAIYSTTTVANATDYIWSFPVGTVINSGQNTPSVSVTFSTTSGNVTVTPSSSCGYGAASVFSVTLNYPPSLYVTAAPSATVCQGSTLTLTGTGAATYTWTGGITNGAAFTPTSTTVYTLTGTSGAGCTGIRVQTVTVNSLPAVAANTSSPSICKGASTSLSGSGASTYTWTGGISNNVAFSPTITTTYTVTGTDANGCKNTAVQTITVNPLPVVTVGAATICAGSTATLTANGASTYSWSTGENGQSIMPSPTSNAVYSVTGTSTDGCVKTVTAAVTVISTPTLTANTATICAGSAATLIASGVSTYTWSNGPNTASVSVSPGSTTSYTVYGDLNGCNTTVSYVTTVTVNALPSVSVTSTSPNLCAGQTATLNASGASSYSWSSSQSGASIVVSPANTTTYTVNGTDANGCSNSATLVEYVSVCTGIAETGSGQGLYAYPNPAGSYFYLATTFADELLVELYDVNGWLVLSEHIAQPLSVVNIEALPCSLYQLRVTAKGAPVYQGKIVKQ